MKRRCSKCNQDFQLSDFWPDPNHRSGLSRRCKKCLPTAPIQEHIVAHSGPGVKRMDKRAIAADLADMCEHKCLACGVVGHALACNPREGVELFAAQIIPTVLGGTKSADNIQPLCADCIRTKGTEIVNYRNDTPSGEPSDI